jgi:hypothetical protein
MLQCCSCFGALVEAKEARYLFSYLTPSYPRCSCCCNTAATILFHPTFSSDIWKKSRKCCCNSCLHSCKPYLPARHFVVCSYRHSRMSVDQSNRPFDLKNSLFSLPLLLLERLAPPTVWVLVCLIKLFRTPRAVCEASWRGVLPGLIGR